MDIILPPALTECSRGVRRAFLLTLPISGAIWLMWAVMGVVILALGALASAIVIILAWIICPTVWAVWKAWELVRDLWSKP